MPSRCGAAKKPSRAGASTLRFPPTRFRNSSRRERRTKFWTSSKARQNLSRRPPAPPKPVAKGMLSLTCAPAECQVSLNGTTIGPTAGGKLEVAGLTPGNWVVDFAKEGFAAHQSTVVVEPAKSAVRDRDARSRSGRARSFRETVVSENDSCAGRRRRAEDAQLGASHRQHHSVGSRRHQRAMDAADAESDRIERYSRPKPAASCMR